MKKFTAESEGTKVEVTLSDSATGHGKINLPHLLETLERSIIGAYFEHYKIKNRVAEFLGLKRSTLVEKMRKLEFPLEKNHRRKKDVDSGI